ncbi:MAG: dihydroneopterin aldolase [Candidatus Peregrinibacteria bacterium]|nr:dihydroneopterin aldolase [Candidatus Peregrinibacteria bacterium]
MSDTLTIVDLSLWTRIGVTEEERAKEQQILIVIEFPQDAAAIAKNDDVRKGIDYAQVIAAVQEVGKEERSTIEALAEDIAAVILLKFRPDSVRVTVTKVTVPGVRCVNLTITRP